MIRSYWIRSDCLTAGWPSFSSNAKASTGREGYHRSPERQDLSQRVLIFPCPGSFCHAIQAGTPMRKRGYLHAPDRGFMLRKRRGWSGGPEQEISANRDKAKDSGDWHA